MNSPLNNPYAASSTSLGEVPDAAPEAASRWQRFAGALVDGIIGGGLAYGTMYVLGTNNPEMLIERGLVVTTALNAVIGLALFWAIQGWLLFSKGQTIGKLAIGTRIVRADDCGPVGKSAIVLRYLPVQIASSIPLVNLLCLVDALFIFGSDRRCLHDHLGGTRVVRV